MAPPSNSEARKRRSPVQTGPRVGFGNAVKAASKIRIVCADGNFEDIPEGWDPAETVRIYDIEDCGPHTVEEVPE